MYSRLKIFVSRAVFFFFAFAAIPATALATQSHGAPEGLYVHQGAHVFFSISMALLIFWLRSRKLVKSPGWRMIQFSALFFILWNTDAFLVHLMGEHLEWIKIQKHGYFSWAIPENPPWPILTAIYYLLKMDHLLCVPAMVFMLLGLKRLARSEPGVRP